MPIHAFSLDQIEATARLLGWYWALDGNANSRWNLGGPSGEYFVNRYNGHVIYMKRAVAERTDLLPPDKERELLLTGRRTIYDSRSTGYGGASRRLVMGV